MKHNLLLMSVVFLFMSIFPGQAVASIPAGDGVEPELMMTSDCVAPSTDFSIRFMNAPTGVNAWIGIYPYGLGPANGSSHKWAYTVAANGALTFKIDEKNAYTAMIFKDGTTDHPGTSKVSFLVGPKGGEFSIDKENYKQGEQMTITYTDVPAIEHDWFAIFKEEDEANEGSYVGWKYLPNGVRTGTLKMLTGEGGDNTLPPGNYYITYLIRDGRYEPFERVYFTVTASTSIKQVSDVSEITYDKTQKRLVLNTTQGGNLSVYAADGKKLADKTLKSGKNFVPLNAAAHQLLIVTWKGNDGKTVSHKIKP